MTDGLTSLVKKVDAIVGKNSDKKMAAFLILLSEDADGSAPKLEEIAKKNGIENTPLTIFDGEAGPGNYKIAKDADVTVLLWRDRTVAANHAFEKGGLNNAAIEKIVADTEKILK